MSMADAALDRATGLHAAALPLLLLALFIWLLRCLSKQLYLVRRFRRHHGPD